MDHDTDRFIAGIYNYCDRWCERCRFTDRCRVYDQEQKQLERHLLRGEDPDDPAVFMQDVADSLSEALGMLEQMAAESGLENDAEPCLLPIERGSDPLAAQAERWGMRVGALLARMRADLPAIGQDLAGQTDALSDREQGEVIQALEGVRDAYEVLAQYHLLIPVKMARAARGEAKAEDEGDPERSPGRWDDALGTAKLVHECLGKAAAALWCAAELSRDWQDEALPLAAEAESLRQQIDRRFPGHPHFRRPGLDELPP